MTCKLVTISERRKRTVSKAKETTNSEPGKQDEEITRIPPTAVKKKLSLKSKAKEITPPKRFPEQDELIIRTRVTASERKRRMKSKENEPTNEEPCAEHDEEITRASVDEPVQKQYRRLKKRRRKLRRGNPLPKMMRY